MRSIIRQLLLDRAVKLYPNEPRLQMLYQIGFLEQQLAEAMRVDSKITDQFVKCVKQQKHSNEQ